MFGLLKSKHMKYSIIIPSSYNWQQNLKPCLESVCQHTPAADVEIIVVSNGHDGSINDCIGSIRSRYSHLLTLCHRPDRIGYPEAINCGIKQSSGEYIVLLNDDTVIMSDMWLSLLYGPFTQDDAVGLTGPFKFKWFIGNIIHEALAFWCVMIKKEVIDDIGMLDTIFTPGMGEDGDFCIRAHTLGWKLVQVPEDVAHQFGTGADAVQTFPIYHKGGATFLESPEKKAIIDRNTAILNERWGSKLRPLISVVIPTYNHCDDLLKPCVESIKTHTNLSNLEIIIIANGCTDNTREYCESLPEPFRLIWSDEALGYTRATNLGIEKSLGEFVILLNNDIILLNQKHNLWIDMLLAPFSDPKVGISGPLMLHDNYADRRVMIFFCVMIRRELFRQIGFLDEIYSPGGGEDIDFCVRAEDMGWRQVIVPDDNLRFVNINVGGFPIYHLGEGTFSNEEHPEYGKRIIRMNGLLNAKRYNKNIRLNLGCGGIREKGFLGVDLYDPHADIPYDITKIHEIFDPGTVSEIMASHVWEHLNPYKSNETLVNWLMLLKPGGKLSMEMPDIERLCAAFGPADKQARYGILNCIYGSVDTVNPSVDGKPTGNITSPHLFGWYPEIVEDHLRWAGYVNIRFLEEKFPHPLYNFRVEAEKPL